jgi:IclR family acetate operon transcriptional repressor
MAPESQTTRHILARTGPAPAREAAPPEGPRDLLTSVARALDVLEAVAEAPAPLPAKAVAQRLDISLGTAYHVLNTLEHAGYVVRLGQGRFGLGPKVPSLYRAFHARLDLVPAVRPLLDELARRAQEDAYLAVFHDSEIVVAEVVGASRDLHVDGLEGGFTRLAHTTAIGKVLLAAAPEETLDGYLDERRLVPYTRRTLVQRRHIKRHLRVVRERGIGKDLEELAEGCCCVAVPVLGTRGEVLGAIGLSTPARRWRAEEAALTELCCEIGVRASNELGLRPATSG